MIVSVVVNGLCAGANHVHLTLSSGGNSVQITMNKSDFAIDFSSVNDVKEVIAHLLRSRVKQSGATTNAQMKNAIESAPFYI